MTCALVALLLLGAAPAVAQGVFKYTDDRGVVHFTNVSPDDRYTQIRVFQSSNGPGRVRPRGPVKTYDALIARTAQSQGIPPAMVKAVIHAESSFDPNAVSRKGAMGLMQLMPATASGLGVSRPFRALDNISGGTRYLRMMHDRYGSWAWALAAYNAGPTAVDKYRGIPPFEETRKYVQRVLTYYRRYDADFSR